MMLLETPRGISILAIALIATATPPMTVAWASPRATLDDTRTPTRITPTEGTEGTKGTPAKGTGANSTPAAGARRDEPALERRLDGLDADATVELDAFAIPLVRAASLADAMRVQGYLHARERFAQMDLMRRSVAGELAELAGELGLPMDRQQRPLRLRAVAERAFAGLAPEERTLVEAYAQGVNAGLRSLERPPAEHALLGATPADWRPEDCLLVGLGMAAMLNDSARFEIEFAAVAATLPREAIDFLRPPTSRWDAPVLAPSDAHDAPPSGPPPYPSADLLDTRRLRDALATEQRQSRAESAHGFAPLPWWEEPAPIGSNGWVVAGRHTKDGRAILASDMHLPLSVPGIWYRMSMEVAPVAAPAEGEPGSPSLALHGLTLPGAPGLIVGSNGHVAWGFTNVEGDFMDFVVVETDPTDPTRYLVPGGSEPFQQFEETLRIGADRSETLVTRATRWGPLVGTDGEGRPLAMMWTAMQPNGLDVGHLRLGRATTTEEALVAAAAMRGPQQNVVIADCHGSIGWTISGYLPLRFGPTDDPLDGSTPRSWADGRRGWKGEWPESDRPRVLNPPSGVIVTANQRTLPVEVAERLGRMWAGPERAARIRTLLEESVTSTSDAPITSERERTEHDAPGDAATRRTIDEGTCATIQLDIRSPRLVAWRDALVASLERGRAAEETAARGSAKDQAERSKQLDATLRLLQSWDGEASVDSKAVGVVSRARELLTAQVASAWVETALLAREPGLSPEERARRATALARRWPNDESILVLLETRPDHLLPPSAASWDALVAQSLLAAIAELRTKEGLPRWGTLNMSSIAHPLARSAPLLASAFRIDPHEQPGHWSTVRVASPRFGASNRLVVAPGRERDATLTTPAGQSANPGSRHYADLHPFWRDGLRAPLLPGPAAERWTLRPLPTGQPAPSNRPQ